MDFFTTESSDSGLLQEVIHRFFPKVKAEPAQAYAPRPASELEIFNGGGSHMFGVEASSSGSSPYPYNYCSEFQAANGILGDIFHYQEALSLVAGNVPNA